MNTNIKKYYVEFVGAHGSGKTFTYHAITKQNLMAPYKALYPGQVRRPKLHFALKWPFIAIKNIRHIIFLICFFFRYAQARQINFKVLRSLMKMIVLHPYYYRYDFDVFLKDDMLHMLQRIMFKKKVNLEEAFREYLMHFIYLYDGLIYVDIEPEVMWRRFKKRFQVEVFLLRRGARLYMNELGSKVRFCVSNYYANSGSVSRARGGTMYTKMHKKLFRFLNRRL